MRSIEGMPGVNVGSYNMNNLRYTDGTVLIARCERDLQVLVDVVNLESKKKGLRLNQKKTEVMVMSKKDTQQTCKKEVEETMSTQVKSFKYL
jgi:hypothetical protein